MKLPVKPARALSCLAGLLAVMCLALIPVSASATTAEPLYAVAFAVDEGVNVSVLYQGDNWVHHALPEGAVFGQRDVALIAPHWSDDGQTLYVSFEYTVEADNDTINHAIYRWHLRSQTFEAVMTPVPDGSFSGARYISIQSISPDEQYAFIWEPVTLDSMLVDLGAGEVIAQTRCPSRLGEWRETTASIEVIDYGFNDPDICPSGGLEVDLATGTIMLVETIPDPAATPEVTNILPTATSTGYENALGDKAVLLSASPDAAWWLYSVLEGSDDSTEDTLLAYAPESSETVTLAENVRLGQRNTAFPAVNYYVWSPLMTPASPAD